MRDEDRVPQGFLCDGRLDGKGSKPIAYSTLLGSVAVTRATSRCLVCHQGVAPLDELLETTPQGMTPAFASAVALVGASEAYAQAETLLETVLQQKVDDNRVQQTVAYVGKLGLRWMILEGEELEQALAELPTAEPVTVYVGVDGGRIRFRDAGWREPCEGVLWWRDPVSGQGKRVVVGDVRNKANVQDALDRFLRGAQSCCRQLTLVLIADGAEWIWRWAEQYEDAIKILDYYHLKEPLYRAAEALYPQDAARVRPWVKNLDTLLWEGDVAEAVAQLGRLRPQGTTTEKAHQQAALDELATYLRNHAGLIAYAEHRQHHRDIGSGVVESMCKQLFNMRLKGPGMFWSETGAQAVIHLRAVRLSNRWNQLWAPPPPAEGQLAVAA